jgi:hypothetical protein
VSASASPQGDAAPAAAEAVRAPAGMSRHHREQTAPFAARFRFALGLLSGLGVGAVALAAVIAAGGRHVAHHVRWSQWAPNEGGLAGARQIADYVAPLYRISPVDQLAVVTVVNLESPAALEAAAAGGSASPGTGLVVAVRQNPSSSALSLLGGNTIAYDLCGVGGADCAIGVGTPSTSRLLLLRREALELALYTFKYIAGTDNVLTILPPGHVVVAGASTLSPRPPRAEAPKSVPVDIAILFDRPELAPLLSRPLADTLPEPVPPTVAEMPYAPEAGLVDQITARGLFSEQLQTAQDGTRLIVLNPLPPS